MHATPSLSCKHVFSKVAELPGPMFSLQEKKTLSFSARTPGGMGDEALPSATDGTTSSSKDELLLCAENAPPPPPPPPPSQVVADGGGIIEHGEQEDWRSFAEAGFLDQTTLREREKEALVRRIQELERELYQYQYHMGLLLIEKQEWDSRFEKLRKEFIETTQSQNRMQATHLIVLSQLQNQEENMRRSMSFQKQKIINLEKALKETHIENQEIKSTQEKKLVEVHALEIEVEEKHMEARAKLHSLNAHLAETSRRSSEIDRRFEDVQQRERKLQKESSFFIVKKNQLEEDILNQREDLYVWEQKLQERWKKLLEGQSLLSEKESRANERGMILKKKEEELNEAWKRLEIVNGSFELQEDDIFVRLRVVNSKEKELLDEKEEKFLSIKELLDTGERAQRQKSFDAHDPILEVQRKYLHIEMKNMNTKCSLKDNVDGDESNNIILQKKENNSFEIEKNHERKTEHMKDKGNQNEVRLNVSKESCSLQSKDLTNKERGLLNEKRLMTETTLIPSNYDKEKFEMWRGAEEDSLRKMKLEIDHTTGQSDDQHNKGTVEENHDYEMTDFCNENIVDLNNHSILKLEKEQKTFASQYEIKKDINVPTRVSSYLMDICPFNDLFDHGNGVESIQTNKVASSVGTQRTPFTASDQLVELERSYEENPQEMFLDETHSFTKDQVSCNSTLKRTFSHVSKTMKTDDIEDYETSKSLSNDYEASKGLSEDYEASESLSEDYEVSESLSSVRCEEGIENISSEIEVPGLRRYNFRYSTIVRAIAVAESLADRSKRKKSDKWNQHENEKLNVSTDDTNETQNSTPSHEFTRIKIEQLNKLTASKDLSPNNLQVKSSNEVKQAAKEDKKCDNFSEPSKNIQEESGSG